MNDNSAIRQVDSRNAHEMCLVLRQCDCITLTIGDEDMVLSDKAVSVLTGALMYMASTSERPEYGSFLLELSPGQVWALRECLRVTAQFAPKHLASRNMRELLGRLAKQFDEMLSLVPRPN